MILSLGDVLRNTRKLPLQQTKWFQNSLRSLTSTPDYQEVLNEYFGETEFNLLPERLEKGMQYLRECMECVYLRQRPLVAFDVEAYERATSKVTEIGIAIYDPQLLKNSIIPQIHSLHLISKENIRMRNSKFCPDNKDFFMGGTSVIATQKETTKAMKKLLEEYIQNRQGAFVGHQIGSDVKWIQKLGINIDPNVTTVDTLKLYSLSRKRGLSLRELLRELQIPHGYLHNAANDAYYTLLAALSLCDPAVRKVHQLDTFLVAPKIAEAQKKKSKFSDRAQTVTFADSARLTTFPTIDNYQELWEQPELEPEAAEKISVEEAIENKDPELLKLLGEADHIQLTLEDGVTRAKK